MNHNVHYIVYNTEEITGRCSLCPDIVVFSATSNRTEYYMTFTSGSLCYRSSEDYTVHMDGGTAGTVYDLCDDVTSGYVDLRQVPKRHYDTHTRHTQGRQIRQNLGGLQR